MTHILLGVTGSIAAFKACQLASDWTKAGHEVRVIETTAAESFVTPLTFTSLTHQPTRTTMFPAYPAAHGDVTANPTVPTTINHVADAAWTNLLVVAPASADVIARIACGLANDTLTSTILAYEGPKILCPAMNVHMYNNPATQRNLKTCAELGWQIVEPEEGNLACGDVDEAVWKSRRASRKWPLGCWRMRRMTRLPHLPRSRACACWSLPGQRRNR